MLEATLVHGSPVMVDHTPSSAVAAGEILEIDSVVRIAHQAIAANTLGALAAGGGVYDVVANGDTEAWVDGDPIYWDDSATEATTAADSGTNKLMGYAVAAKGASATTGRIQHVAP